MKFSNLETEISYDIIDSETGNHITQGIQGSDAIGLDWPDAAEAWPTGETEFSGAPVEVAS